MNTEIKTDITTQEAPKSKRLSSFIWILVMWVTLRLFAELNPISWELGFWRGAFFLITYPTIFLLLSIVVRPLKLETPFRWSAFFMILGTLIGGYSEQSRGGPYFWDFELPFLQAFVFFLIVCIAFYKWRNSQIQKGDVNA